MAEGEIPHDVVLVDDDDIKDAVEECSKSLVGRLLADRSFSAGTLESPPVPEPQQPRSSELLDQQLSLLSSHLCTSCPPEELDKLGELWSMTERKCFRASFLSPLSPAYDKLARLRSGARLAGGFIDEEEEEACQSFQSCMAKMLAEEGKVSDLIDVEELLCN
ncbi:hypothetical protein Cni_G13320 [Canna indica]|uniref:Uncharacterized protein n=1 Tax=Canna indica TaxID=4628 RepID=A0AAQ3KCC8_9LILI|nr:hypothetical protein Cni_G13320 [Canna indica]